jgi:hypothetical protein
MNRPARTLHLIVGPPEHGVVRFATALAGGLGDPIIRLEELAAFDLALPAHLGEAPVVHLQYSDALYGRDTGSAAEAFCRLCERVRLSAGALLSVTLHDLPDPGDEPGRYARRAASYQRVCAAVDLVMVSSNHEARLLRGLPDAGQPRSPDPVVVPLPVGTPAITSADRRPVPLPEVAVFGFVYPRKGHQEVLDAMSGLPAGIWFSALGRIADGHDELGRDLSEQAARSGRRFRLTGFVPDDELTLRLQRVAVPVAPARTVSASGSINSWIAAGRRPLVAQNPYADELARRYPEAVRLYRPGQLARSIAATLAEPGVSWLVNPLPEELSGPATSQAHSRAFAALRARPAMSR